MDGKEEYWKKQCIKPRGRMGITHTSEGNLYLVVREVSGQLWESEESKDGFKEWNSIEEVYMEDIDLNYGVLMAFHKRDGRMALFSRTLSGEIVTSWLEIKEQNKRISWKGLGGDNGGSMEVCERNTGGIEVFRLDSSNQLWHLWSNKEAQWSLWQMLGESVNGVIAIANNEEGFPQVFGKVGDGSVSVRRHHNDGTWGEWNILKDKDAAIVRCIQEKDGRIRLIILDIDGRIQTNRQDVDADKWLGWEVLPSEGYVNVQIMADRNKTVILGIRYDGNIYYMRQKENGWEIKGERLPDVKCITTATLLSGNACLFMIGQGGWLYRKEWV